MAEPAGRYADLLRDARFRAYFVSQSVAEAGYGVYSITIVWLSFQLSGSLLVAGLVLFTEFGIYSFSFVAGPIVDRARNQRSVLLLAFPLQGVGAVAIGVSLWAGALSIPLLLALVVAISFLWDFSWTATNAMLPRLVPPGTLFRANGLLTMATGVTQIAGYAVGASLLFLVGPAGGAVAYGVLNFVAALLTMPVSVPRSPGPVPPFGESFVEGWRYLVAPAGRPLLEFSLFSSAQAFLTTAPPLLIALLAATEFGHSGGTYGVLYTVFALGGALGGFLVGHTNPRRRIPLVLTASTIGEGALLLLAVRVTPALLASAAAWFAVGVADFAFYTAVIVYVQATTPSPLLGRTLTNSYVFRGTSRAAGAVALGALSGVLSPFALGTLVAGYFVAVGVVVPLLLPATRKLAY